MSGWPRELGVRRVTRLGTGDPRSGGRVRRRRRAASAGDPSYRSAILVIGAPANARHA